MSETGKRRGPGRPPSKIPTPNVNMRGITTAPDDAENYIELVYNDPSIFKSLFAYFKNIKARDIKLRCRPDSHTFFARDHSYNSRIIAHMPGDKIAWHYCESEIWMAINRENVEKMFAAIDKTFFKVIIKQTRQDKGILEFSFIDAILSKECQYKITLSDYIHDEDLCEAEYVLNTKALVKLFPIEFTLSSKQFKKSIIDIAGYSETISFERERGDVFKFTYANSLVKYNEVYQVPEKLKLRIDVPDEYSFHCVANINNIKSLATSMIADSVKVFCRENDDILFQSTLSDSLIISTLTKIT